MPWAQTLRWNRNSRPVPPSHSADQYFSEPDVPQHAGIKPNPGTREPWGLQAPTEFHHHILSTASLYLKAR